MFEDFMSPAGRGGSCELMIGCIAKAKSDELHMDDSEMEEVRWVSKADVSKALERSSGKDNPLVGEAPCHWTRVLRNVTIGLMSWVFRADVSKALGCSSGKDEDPLVGEALPLRIGKPE
jgi:hypothetical protein